MLVRISEIFPITYGFKAPVGFGGTPDYVQQRFNRVIHLSQWPHDASYDEIDAGLVISIPGWAHWIAFGELATGLNENEVKQALACYKATLDAIANAIGVTSFGRCDYYARIQLSNEQVFEEWLADYASREGMAVDVARRSVMEERKNAARAAGRVAGDTSRREYQRAELEDYDLSGYEFDPVRRDHRLSYEFIRAQIKRK